MPSLFPKTHLIWFPLIASVNDGAVRACVMQDAAQVGDKDPKARLVHQGCSTSLGSGRDELFFFFLSTHLMYFPHAVCMHMDNLLLSPQGNFPEAIGPLSRRTWPSLRYCGHRGEGGAAG